MAKVTKKTLSSRRITDLAPADAQRSWGQEKWEEAPAVIVTTNVAISVTMAARRTGMTVHTIHRCIQRGLVVEPLTEDDLIVLRRIRRLTDIGVNLAGVEIILRMRQRILELQQELQRIQSLANRGKQGQTGKYRR